METTKFQNANAQNEMTNNIVLDSINKRIENLTSTLHSCEKEIENLKTELERIKYGQSICAHSYSASVPKITKQTDDIVDDETSTNEEHIPISPIIPKRLNYNGYQNISDVIEKNSPINIFSFCSVFKKISVALTFVGKELVLIKEKNSDRNNDYSVFYEEFHKICSIYDKISTAKENHDYDGYNRGKDAFNKMYHYETNIFEEDKPMDFFPNKNKSLFFITCCLVDFVKSWESEINNSIEEMRNLLPKGSIRGENEDIQMTNYLFKIDPLTIKIELYKELKDFALSGYSFCIVPIANEDILNRPRKAAEDEEYLSLLYYKDYIDIEDLTENNNISVLDGYSYNLSFGNEYVKSHYRKGYYRNGKYVSGGFVKGHYRSK